MRRVQALDGSATDAQLRLMWYTKPAIFVLVAAVTIALIFALAGNRYTLILTNRDASVNSLKKEFRAIFGTELLLHYHLLKIFPYICRFSVSYRCTTSITVSPT